MINRWLILSSIMASLFLGPATALAAVSATDMQTDRGQTSVSLRGSIFTDDDCDPINDPGGCRRS